MEAEEEAKSDVDSLRKLYILLQQTCLDMDERTRLFFRNLLDSARDNMVSAFLFLQFCIVFEALYTFVSSVLCVLIDQMVAATRDALSLKPPIPSKPLSPSPSPLQSQSRVAQRNKRCRVCQQTGFRQHSGPTNTEFAKQVSHSIQLLESLHISSSVNQLTGETSKRIWSSNGNVSRAVELGFRYPQSECLSHHYVHGLRIPPSKDNVAKHPSSSHTVEMKQQHSQDSSFHDDCVKNMLMKPMLVDYDQSKRQQKQKTKQTCTSSSTSSYSRADTESESSRTDVSPESSSYESRSSHSSYTSSASPVRKAKKVVRSSSPEKAGGKLTRLKNRLRVIFHHHHHHHHHHNRGSMWKKIKVKQKEKGYEKKAVEKVKVKEGGQFQAMVKGLMKHAKQKQKKKKKNMGIRGQNQHWWKLLKHNGGVRLPNKGRVRLHLQPNK
ncbi:LOW QUALITY PROTEIN: protein KOKOPELLI [Mercurialis annua]|uniref:LOW QUALITY PROTEIN: protein KOKOPELLI n=1 Tax=Mercurialis annua TaxID=3986 RepID=UPI0024AC98E9|nr:LOW QUALITY PROTEIN: protein KOKOPELLI [Mercurialis annua]